MNEYNVLGPGSAVVVAGQHGTVIAPATQRLQQYSTGDGIISVFAVLMESGEVRWFSREAIKWPVREAE